MIDIGQKIKKIREFRGYTQEYLADQLSVSQKTYSQIENNQTKLGVNRLQKIADVLDIGFTDIFSLDDKAIFNHFNDKVNNNNNASVIMANETFEDERKAYLKYIAHLEKENEYLKIQLDKILNK